MSELNKESFEPLIFNKDIEDENVRPNISYWKDAWRRLRKNYIAMISLVTLGIIVIMVIIGPHIRGIDYMTIHSSVKNLTPSSKYWFGTDSLGRDMFSRVWVGARVSIIIAVVATVVQIVVGCIYGGIMAYFGGFVDEIMMRMIEILSSIPNLIFTILIIVVLGGGLFSLLIALCITAWIGTARMIRGQIMQLRESEYVLAAEALGASPARIIIKHLLPNTIGLIILDLATSIPSYIFSETVLSFLGFGIQPPKFSLGSLLSIGQENMAFYPYQLIYPSIVLCVIVLAFNLFGDGLRDALDPKLRD